MQNSPNKRTIGAGSVSATRQLIEATLATHFPKHSVDFITAVFADVERAFAGEYPGYQKCDMAYHDFAHTCQAAIATVRILDGQIKSGRPPALTARDFELAIAGILLHDIGYLKETGDHAGTGAKYTLNHVDRSAAFAEPFLKKFGVKPDEIRVVQLAIHCTGVTADTAAMPFGNATERFLGCALGTGDILGQMAAPDYPERLPALGREFKEAVAVSTPEEGKLLNYHNTAELFRQTREFFNDHVQNLLENQWGGVYHRLKDHFADGRSHYMEAIATNLDRIDQMVAQPHAKIH